MKPEEQKKRAAKAKLESLYNMGGFIKERLEQELCEGVDMEIIDAVERYFAIGPGFTHIVNRVEDGAIRMGNASSYMRYNEMIDEENPFEEGLEKISFYDWYLNQLARYEAQKYREAKEPLWQKWEFNRSTKKVLMSLDAFEEKLLLLHLGLDDGVEHSEDEIIEIADLRCTSYFVKHVLQEIKSLFSAGNVNWKEFASYCKKRSSAKSEKEKTAMREEE